MQYFSSAATMSSTARTQFQELITPTAFRSYLAEFFSTFLFVFASVGSAMSARKVTAATMLPDAAAVLVATALAQGFALFAAIFVATDFSGGHVNPAVTFAFAVIGQIPIPSAIFYCISQMTAATLACTLLHLATAGQEVPTTGIAQEMTGFGAAVIESVSTFTLVYAVLVSSNQKASTSPPGAVVGLVLAAFVVATGGFTGGSMNPARSFGPAVVSGSFKNQAVYWVGPLVGAAVAALVHQNLVLPAEDGCSSSAMVLARGRGVTEGGAV